MVTKKWTWQRWSARQSKSKCLRASNRFSSQLIFSSLNSSNSLLSTIAIVAGLTSTQHLIHLSIIISRLYLLAEAANSQSWCSKWGKCTAPTKTYQVVALHLRRDCICNKLYLKEPLDLPYSGWEEAVNKKMKRMWYRVQIHHQERNKW